MKRHGVTLIECLVAMTLALVVAAALWTLGGRADSLCHESARAVDIDVSVRDLMENLTRDVPECQQVMDPGATHALVLVKPATDGVERRLAQNPDPVFPFRAAGVTRQRMDVLRVTYAWDAARRTVTRREEPGWLVAEAGEATLTRFTFEPDGPTSERTLATRVAAFDLSCIAYRDGKLERLTPGTTAFERTVCVAVHVDCRADEGEYRSDRPQPRVELLTKIWSTKRRSDEVYGEYFSSTDEDLLW